MGNQRSEIRQQRQDAIYALLNNHLGVWMTAAQVTALSDLDRRQVIWALTKLRNAGLIMATVNKSPPTASRAYEHRHIYCRIYTEKIGRNKWLQILGMEQVDSPI